MIYPFTCCRDHPWHNPSGYHCDAAIVEQAKAKLPLARALNQYIKIECFNLADAIVFKSHFTPEEQRWIRFTWLFQSPPDEIAADRERLIDQQRD